MTFRPGHLVAAVGLTLAMVSCGAPPTAPPTGSGPAGGAAKFQQYESLKGQERRDTLLKDAKAEGEVSLYTSMTSDVASAVSKAFTDQTGIKVNLYRADSETVLQRILQEASANHAGADVVETDALEMASLGKEQLVEPYTGERRDLVGAEGKFDELDRGSLQPLCPQLEHDQGACRRSAQDVGGPGQSQVGRRARDGTERLRLVPDALRVLAATR